VQRPYAGLENAQASLNVVLSPDAHDAMGVAVTKLFKTSPVIEIEMPSRDHHSHGFRLLVAMGRRGVRLSAP